MSAQNDVSLGQLAPPASLMATLYAEREAYKTFQDYFSIVDSKLPCEQAANCFTEKAEIEYHMKGSPMIFHGRSEFLRFLEVATPPQQMTAHVVGQSRFEWIDGKLLLHAYVTSWQWYTANAHLGEMRPADFVTIAKSTDEFAAVEGKWLIARRVAKPVAGLVAAGSPPPALQ